VHGCVLFIFVVCKVVLFCNTVACVHLGVGVVCVAGWVGCGVGCIDSVVYYLTGVFWFGLWGCFAWLVSDGR